MGLGTGLVKAICQNWN